MAKKTKEEMLKEMKEAQWDWRGLTKDNSYNEIKEEYDVMIDEMSSDIDMYPNGHDDDEDD